jgi:hypothetical protein
MEGELLAMSDDITRHVEGALERVELLDDAARRLALGGGLLGGCRRGGKVQGDGRQRDGDASSHGSSPEWGGRVGV